MINKRGLFKGVAGGAAAALLQSRGSQPPRLPQTYLSRQDAGGFEYANVPQHIPNPDPLWRVKNAFREHAEEIARVEAMAISYKMRSLERMQSVSQAYIDYHMHILEKERSAVWTRFNTLMRGL